MRKATVTRYKAKNGSIAAAVAMAVGALIASGCGGDDEKKAKPQRLSVAVSEQGKDRPARLSVSSAPRPGVVTAELRNTGKLAHSAGLIRIDGNHTPQEVLKLIKTEGGPIPAWVHAAGGVQEIRPGTSGSATQRLVVGNYFVLDDAEGVKPAISRFTVEGDDAGGDLPSATAKIEAREYSFTASGLKAGKNTVEFANRGGQIHHVVAARIKPGGTIADVRKGLNQERGEPPLDFESAASTQVLDGGGALVTQLDLPKSGKYALMCFVQDRQGGPPHVAKGMVTETQVE
jgi:hypothetical protein